MRKKVHSTLVESNKYLPAYQFYPLPVCGQSLRWRKLMRHSAIIIRPCFQMFYKQCYAAEDVLLVAPIEYIAAEHCWLLPINNSTVSEVLSAWGDLTELVSLLCSDSEWSFIEWYNRYYFCIASRSWYSLFLVSSPSFMIRSLVYSLTVLTRTVMRIFF